MSGPDFNLLTTLNVLLAEGSVARAAERLHLSPSAMSRALARLRESTGDPLLVRAGRGLVPTPRALEIREQVSQLVEAGTAILRPADKLDLKRLVRTFTLRAREGFVENFGARLIAGVGAEAPFVRLSFAPKPDKKNEPLRDGLADFEIGVVGDSTGPEIRAQALFDDRLVGVVRKSHPLLKRKITLARYAAGKHISVSRRGLRSGPVEQALTAAGLTRDVTTTVGGFSAALSLVRCSDLIDTVPVRSTGYLRSGLHSFALPFVLPAMTLSLLWHPRFDGDQAHRWLRGKIRVVCGPR